ncbi:MAG: ribonuclease Y [Deltaproteobacteria bacterium]|nr:ribonuclease Y [Deltaproteobacteria bacterium]
MISNIMAVIIAIGAAAGGAVGGYLIRRSLSAKQLDSSERLSERIIGEAKKEADNIKKEAMLQAKDYLLKVKADFESETRERRIELENLEKRLRSKEENLDKRMDVLVQKESEFEHREKALLRKDADVQLKQQELERLIRGQQERLEKIAGITADEAKNFLIQSMAAEAKHDAAVTIRNIEDETKREAVKKARGIIASAIQRYAADYVAENTVSVVPLPSDEMKGRIIGREGRNIRAIEAATGTDLIIDDTPEAVVLSSFDPIRREIARIALERLISDGRIHPGRIEDIVTKVKLEVEQLICETGKEVCFDVGIHDVHAELVVLLGKLKYRTSFSQNVLQHSLEVAHMTGMMAAELGMNIREAKRAGMLHDIGKAVDYEVEGTHAAIGADYAKRFGEAENIVNAIAMHHDDGRSNTILGVLVQAADSLSAARPGARKEMLETYIRRLNDLERIARSFAGVENCYAIQAGREIRILVENERISDNDIVMLSRDIIKKIESELTYPGQIKVTLIRETRLSDYAR